jgi:hypothetical protein
LAQDTRGHVLARKQLSGGLGYQASPLPGDDLQRGGPGKFVAKAPELLKLPRVGTSGWWRQASGSRGAQEILRAMAPPRARPASISPPAATAETAARSASATNATSPTCSTLADPLWLMRRR